MHGNLISILDKAINKFELQAKDTKIPVDIKKSKLAKGPVKKSLTQKSPLSKHIFTKEEKAIWNHMGHRQQLKYLSDHPKSKYQALRPPPQKRKSSNKKLKVPDEHKEAVAKVAALVSSSNIKIAGNPSKEEQNKAIANFVNPSDKKELASKSTKALKNVVNNLSDEDKTAIKGEVATLQKAQKENPGTKYSDLVKKGLVTGKAALTVGVALAGILSLGVAIIAAPDLVAYLGIMALDHSLDNRSDNKWSDSKKSKSRSDDEEEDDEDHEYRGFFGTIAHIFGENYNKARAEMGHEIKKVVDNNEQDDVDENLDEDSNNTKSRTKTKASLNQIISLLNYREKKDGGTGNAQDDEDQFGPTYLAPTDKPTYAALKLHPASARLLKKWAESRGIKNVYSPGEFHITTVYSREPISYKPHDFKDGPEEVYPDKLDLLGREPDKMSVVLKLKKGDLPDQRFKAAKDAGASHDFPEYLPHITIAPPGHGITDVSELEDIDLSEIDFPLLIDYEYCDELNPPEEATSKELLYAAEMKDINKKEYKVGRKFIHSRVLDQNNRPMKYVITKVDDEHFTYKPLDSGHSEYNSFNSEKKRPVVKEWIEAAKTDYVYIGQFGAFWKIPKTEWIKICKEAVINSFGFTLPDRYELKTKPSFIRKNKYGKGFWASGVEYLEPLDWTADDFKNYLTQNKIESSDEESYGYWIDHEGKLIEVQYEQHIVAPRNYLQTHKPEIADKLREIKTPYDKAYLYNEAAQDLGWIKITSGSGDVGISFKANTLNNKTISTFRKFIMERKDNIENFYGDWTDIDKYGNPEKHRIDPIKGVDFSKILQLITQKGKKSSSIETTASDANQIEKLLKKYGVSTKEKKRIVGTITITQFRALAKELRNQGFDKGYYPRYFQYAKWDGENVELIKGIPKRGSPGGEDLVDVSYGRTNDAEETKASEEDLSKKYYLTSFQFHLTNRSGLSINRSIQAYTREDALKKLKASGQIPRGFHVASASGRAQIKANIEAAWYDSMPPTSWSKTQEDVDIYKNPTRNELHEITKYDSVAMLLHGENSYAWDRFKSSLHYNIIKYLKLKDPIPIQVSYNGKEAYIMVTDASRNTRWHHNGEVYDAVKNHPYIKHLFKKVSVVGYDEDIEGKWGAKAEEIKSGFDVIVDNKTIKMARTLMNMGPIDLSSNELIKIRQLARQDKTIPEILKEINRPDIKVDQFYDQMKKYYNLQLKLKHPKPERIIEYTEEELSKHYKPYKVPKRVKLPEPTPSKVLKLPPSKARLPEPRYFLRKTEQRKVDAFKKLNPYASVRQIAKTLKLNKKDLLDYLRRSQTKAEEIKSANKKFDPRALDNINALSKHKAKLGKMTFIHGGTPLSLTLAAIKAGIKEGQKFESQMGMHVQTYVLKKIKGEDRTPNGLWAVPVGERDYDKVLSFSNPDMDIKTLKEEPFAEGMIVKTQIWTMNQDPDHPTVPMKIVYTTNGDYVGNPQMAKVLADRGIIPQKRNPDSNVCSIGFSKRTGKWYGWSHRAIHGFKSGDVVKKGDSTASSGWTKEYLEEHPEDDIALPVGFKAKNLDDAKRMAEAFAESVSSVQEEIEADIKPVPITRLKHASNKPSSVKIDIDVDNIPNSGYVIPKSDPIKVNLKRSSGSLTNKDGKTFEFKENDIQCTSKDGDTWIVDPAIFAKTYKRIGNLTYTKKPIPIRFRKSLETVTLQTKEGPVQANVGDLIMTGVDGEEWPVPPYKFKEIYDIFR